MTSRERFLRTINRQSTDFVPVAPFMFDLAARVGGATIKDFVTSGQVMADSQLALHREVDQDVIFIGSDNYYIAEGFGCRTNISENENPSLSQPVIKNLEDIGSLSIPDPYRDGRMPVMLEATRRVREAVGNKVAIRTPGTGPFALASYFVGTQAFLMEVALADRGLPGAQPEAIHQALDLAAESLIHFGRACFEAGSDLLHCGDSLASCDMISPGMYERFAFPYQKKVISAWKAMGAKTLLHICGNATSVLPLYAATGADVVEIDHKVDIRFAKQVIGETTTIMGNLDPVSVLLQGTPTKVREAALACLEAAAPGGGFVLGSGCMVSRLTPLENLKAMVATARSFNTGRIGPANQR